MSELANVKHKFSEPIEEYLNIFYLLKAMCFTEVPEHELVKMVVRGLDLSIRKKLDPNYLRNMPLLTERVRHVECLKVEMARENRSHKQERVVYFSDSLD